MPRIRRYAHKKMGPRGLPKPTLTVLSGGFQPVNSQARHDVVAAPVSRTSSRVLCVDLSRWTKDTVRYYLKTNYPELSPGLIEDATTQALRDRFLIGRFRTLPKGTRYRLHATGSPWTTWGVT
jgi:hypothetical protein